MSISPTKGLIFVAIVAGLVALFVTQQISSLDSDRVASKLDDAEQPIVTVQDDEIKQDEVVVDKDTELKPGWVEYRNDELGISFSYPESWGELTGNRHNSETIFNSGFSNTSRTDLPNGVMFYVNSGKQDFSNFGRGGAEWDCLGFEQVDSKYFCRSIYIVDGETITRLVELSNVKVHKAVNTDVITHSGEFFTNNRFKLEVNLNRDFYGAAIVIQDTPEVGIDMEVLEEVARTVEVFY